jgi:hypothetical protein
MHCSIVNTIPERPPLHHPIPSRARVGAGIKGKRQHDSFNLGSLSMAAYEWR